MDRFPCPILEVAHSLVNYVQFIKEFQTHNIEMPNEQCLRIIIRILRILENFNRPDPVIWNELLEYLTEVITFINDDLEPEEEQEQEQEEEIDR